MAIRFGVNDGVYAHMFDSLFISKYYRVSVNVFDLVLRRRSVSS